MKIPVMRTVINSFQEKKLLEEGLVNFNKQEKNQLINILAGLKDVDLSEVTDEFILNHHKEMKASTLSDACEDAILVGFTAKNGHFYRTNRDDQVNLIGQKDLLTGDPEEMVPWKTENDGYVIHTAEEWLEVYLEAFVHKRTQLYKYNELKTKVLAATSHEEVLSINWDEPAPEEPQPIEPQPEEPTSPPVEEPTPPIEVPTTPIEEPEEPEEPTVPVEDGADETIELPVEEDPVRTDEEEDVTFPNEPSEPSETEGEEGDGTNDFPTTEVEVPVEEESEVIKEEVEESTEETAEEPLLPPSEEAEEEPVNDLEPGAGTEDEELIEPPVEEEPVEEPAPSEDESIDAQSFGAKSTDNGTKKSMFQIFNREKRK